MKGKIRTAMEYVCIAAGCFLLAVGLEVFLVPLKLSPGGVSSLGTVFLHIFRVPLAVTNLVFNVVLFAAGYKLLGKETIIKSAFGVAFTTVFLSLLENLPPVQNDSFCAALAGGALIGTGVGLVIRCGASTGGSDLAAMMLLKFMPHLSVADMILIIDAVVIFIASLVFGSITVLVYSVACLYVAAKVTDAVITMGNSAKSVYIATGYPEEISSEVIKNLDRGITGIYAKGMYTDRERMLLWCVVSPKQLPALISIVRSNDKGAFIVIEDAKEVFGEGFLEDN